jgi:Response regulator containing a CheY-like receiver domain and an HTH DNA-binding domain
MLRIVLADDHQLFRDGLRTLLGQQADMEVVGEAIDGLSAVEAVGRLRPDILLMDISMSGLNGLEATRRILVDGSTTRVIMLSMHADQRYVTEALRAGALGYVLKDSAIGELLGGDPHRCAGGGRYLSAMLADRVIGEYVDLAGERILRRSRS